MPVSAFHPRRIPVGLSLLAAALALAGCQSSRIGALNTQPVVSPLPPQPAGNVSQTQLPPVSSSQFPDAPVVAGAPTLGDPVTVDPANPTPGAQPQPTNAAPVTREALVGAWRVSTGGSNCQVFMALTQWTGGYRAASRGCPGEAASIAAWDVSGSQVVLKNSTGDTVARLFSSGASSYNGTLSGGQPISLSR